MSGDHQIMNSSFGNDSHQTIPGHTHPTTYLSPKIWNQIQRLNESMSEKPIEKVISPIVDKLEPPATKEPHDSRSPPPEKSESEEDHELYQSEESIDKLIDESKDLQNTKEIRETPKTKEPDFCRPPPKYSERYQDKLDKLEEELKQYFDEENIEQIMAETSMTNDGIFYSRPPTIEQPITSPSSQQIDPDFHQSIERLNRYISEEAVENISVEVPECGAQLNCWPTKAESNFTESVEAEPQSHKTIDDIIDVTNFPIFQFMNIEESLKKKIVFVCHYFSTWIIFITEDDDVYSFGWNGNGCLGLGDRNNRMEKPFLNDLLSHKKLIDIACGLNHCIGLTSDGLCYSWGSNASGQLGLGGMMYLNTPQLIKQIKYTKVVQISCGSEHSMALNQEGEVFTWGRNNLGQLGDGQRIDCHLPSKIIISETISWISCGRFHSLALSTTGKLFVWGLNERGQLGRHRNEDKPKDKFDDRPVCKRPSIVNSLVNVIIKKAVCGPYHTLALSEEGEVFAFGGNDNGQTGGGTKHNVFEPIKILKEVKVKDIITTPRNNLSLAISEDSQCFIWGLVNNDSVVKPQLISMSNERSVFDVYAICCRYKVLFKSLMVNEDSVFCFEGVSKSSPRSSFSLEQQKLNYAIDSMENDLNNRKSGQLANGKEHWYNKRENHHQLKSITKNNQDDWVNSGHQNDLRSLQQLIKETFDLIESTKEKTPKISGDESIVVSQESFVSKAMNKRLKESFNNPEDFDLKFISGEKTLYCQKGFIKFRSKKFWKKIKPNIDQNNEILITCERFEECYEFVKWLYGMEPNLKDTNVYRLQGMAKLFGEQELMNQCSHYVNRNVCLDNVCALYKKSITIEAKDLEKTCIEFTAKNLEAVIKSEAFRQMNPLTKTRLITSVSNSQ